MVAQGEFFEVFVDTPLSLSLIHISEPTRRTPISYAVFCLKKAWFGCRVVLFVFYERIFLSSLIYLLIMQIFLDDNLKLLFTYGVIMFNLLIIFIKFKHLISSISDITLSLIHI